MARGNTRKRKEPAKICWPAHLTTGPCTRAWGGVYATLGCYDEVLAQLTEAKRLAPKLAGIHQCRASVAFLQGGKASAVAALKKTSEIEPANVLFRRNLERLTAARVRVCT